MENYLTLITFYNYNEGLIIKLLQFLEVFNYLDTHYISRIMRLIADIEKDLGKYCFT